MTDILFEDKSIIVCLKPAGLQSQGGKNDLVAMLDEYFSKGDPSAKAYPVHRLDRETAGIMVFAKTQRAAAQLSAQITRNEMKKHYYAVVQGMPDETGVFKDLLFHDRQKNKTYAVKRSRKGVKEASLEFKRISVQENVALVDVLLHTGRTHQIRVQFASRKMPLLGDGKYGGANGRLALFAYKLEFNHPETNKALCFSATPANEYPWNLFDSAL